MFRFLLILYCKSCFNVYGHVVLLTNLHRFCTIYFSRKTTWRGDMNYLRLVEMGQRVRRVAGDSTALTR